MYEKKSAHLIISKMAICKQAARGSVCRQSTAPNRTQMGHLMATIRFALLFVLIFKCRYSGSNSDSLEFLENRLLSTARRDGLIGEIRLFQEPDVGSKFNNDDPSGIADDNSILSVPPDIVSGEAYRAHVLIAEGGHKIPFIGSERAPSGETHEEALARDVSNSAVLDSSGRPPLAVDSGDHDVEPGNDIYSVGFPISGEAGVERRAIVGLGKDVVCIERSMVLLLKYGDMESETARHSASREETERKEKEAGRNGNYEQTTKNHSQQTEFVFFEASTKDADFSIAATARQRVELGGVMKLTVVHLATSIGTYNSEMVISTSMGEFTLTMSGENIANEYDVLPVRTVLPAQQEPYVGTVVVGNKLPNTTLRLYSLNYSGDFFAISHSNLEKLSADEDGLSRQIDSEKRIKAANLTDIEIGFSEEWVIGNIVFNLPREDVYHGVIRIQTSRHNLTIPVCVRAVSSNLYIENNDIDFGVFRTAGEAREVDLSLSNTGEMATTWKDDSTERTYALDEALIETDDHSVGGAELSLSVLFRSDTVRIPSLGTVKDALALRFEATEEGSVSGVLSIIATAPWGRAVMPVRFHALVDYGKLIFNPFKLVFTVASPPCGMATMSKDIFVWGRSRQDERSEPGTMDHTWDSRPEQGAELDQGAETDAESEGRDKPYAGFHGISPSEAAKLVRKKLLQADSAAARRAILKEHLSMSKNKKMQMVIQSKGSEELDHTQRTRVSFGDSARVDFEERSRSGNFMYPAARVGDTIYRKIHLANGFRFPLQLKSLSFSEALLPFFRVESAPFSAVAAPGDMWPAVVVSFAPTNDLTNGAVEMRLSGELVVKTNMSSEHLPIHVEIATPLTRAMLATSTADPSVDSPVDSTAKLEETTGNWTMKRYLGDDAGYSANGTNRGQRATHVDSREDDLSRKSKGAQGRVDAGMNASEGHLNVSFDAVPRLGVENDSSRSSHATAHQSLLLHPLSPISCGMETVLLSQPIDLPEIGLCSNVLTPDHSVHSNEEFGSSAGGQGDASQYKGLRQCLFYEIGLGSLVAVQEKSLQLKISNPSLSPMVVQGAFANLGPQELRVQSFGVKLMEEADEALQDMDSYFRETNRLALAESIFQQEEWNSLNAEMFDKKVEDQTFMSGLSRFHDEAEPAAYDDKSTLMSGGFPVRKVMGGVLVPPGNEAIFSLSFRFDDNFLVDHLLTHDETASTRREGGGGALTEALIDTAWSEDDHIRQATTKILNLDEFLGRNRSRLDQDAQNVQSPNTFWSDNLKKLEIAFRTPSGVITVLPKFEYHRGLIVGNPSTTIFQSVSCATVRIEPLFILNAFPTPVHITSVESTDDRIEVVLNGAGIVAPGEELQVGSMVLAPTMARGCWFPARAEYECLVAIPLIHPQGWENRFVNYEAQRRAAESLVVDELERVDELENLSSNLSNAEPVVRMQVHESPTTSNRSYIHTLLSATMFFSASRIYNEVSVVADDQDVNGTSVSGGPKEDNRVRADQDEEGALIGKSSYVFPRLNESHRVVDVDALLPYNASLNVYGAPVFNDELEKIGRRRQTFQQMVASGKNVLNAKITIGTDVGKTAEFAVRAKLVRPEVFPFLDENNTVDFGGTDVGSLRGMYIHVHNPSSFKVPFGLAVGGEQPGVRRCGGVKLAEEKLLDTRNLLNERYFCFPPSWYRLRMETRRPMESPSPAVSFVNGIMKRLLPTSFATSLFLLSKLSLSDLRQSAMLLSYWVLHGPEEALQKQILLHYDAKTETETSSNTCSSCSKRSGKRTESIQELLHRQELSAEELFEEFRRWKETRDATKGPYEEDDDFEVEEVEAKYDIIEPSFFVMPTAISYLELEPNESGRLGPIYFMPRKTRPYSAEIYVRNSLTQISTILLRGRGSKGKVSFSALPSEPTRVASEEVEGVCSTSEDESSADCVDPRMAKVAGAFHESPPILFDAEDDASVSSIVESNDDHWPILSQVSSFLTAGDGGVDSMTGPAYLKNVRIYNHGSSSVRVLGILIEDAIRKYEPTHGRLRQESHAQGHCASGGFSIIGCNRRQMREESRLWERRLWKRIWGDLKSVGNSQEYVEETQGRTNQDAGVTLSIDPFSTLPIVESTEMKSFSLPQYIPPYSSVTIPIAFRTDCSSSKIDKTLAIYSSAGTIRTRLEAVVAQRMMRKCLTGVIYRGDFWRPSTYGQSSVSGPSELSETQQGIPTIISQTDDGKVPLFDSVPTKSPGGKGRDVVEDVAESHSILYGPSPLAYSSIYSLLQLLQFAILAMTVLLTLSGALDVAATLILLHKDFRKKINASLSLRVKRIGGSLRKGDPNARTLGGEPGVSQTTSSAYESHSSTKAELVSKLEESARNISTNISHTIGGILTKISPTTLGNDLFRCGVKDFLKEKGVLKQSIHALKDTDGFIEPTPPADPAGVRQCRSLNRQKTEAVSSQVPLPQNMEEIYESESSSPQRIVSLQPRSRKLANVSRSAYVARGEDSPPVRESNARRALCEKAERSAGSSSNKISSKEAVKNREGNTNDDGNTIVAGRVSTDVDLNGKQSQNVGDKATAENSSDLGSGGLSGELGEATTLERSLNAASADFRRQHLLPVTEMATCDTTTVKTDHDSENGQRGTTSRDLSSRQMHETQAIEASSSVHLVKHEFADKEVSQRQRKPNTHGSPASSVSSQDGGRSASAAAESQHEESSSVLESSRNSPRVEDESVVPAEWRGAGIQAASPSVLTSVESCANADDILSDMRSSSESPDEMQRVNTHSSLRGSPAIDTPIGIRSHMSDSFFSESPLTRSGAIKQRRSDAMSALSSEVLQDRKPSTGATPFGSRMKPPAFSLDLADPDHDGARLPFSTAPSRLKTHLEQEVSFGDLDLRVQRQSNPIPATSRAPEGAGTASTLERSPSFQPVSLSTDPLFDRRWGIGPTLIDDWAPRRHDREVAGRTSDPYLLQPESASHGLQGSSISQVDAPMFGPDTLLRSSDSTTRAVGLRNDCGMVDAGGVARTRGPVGLATNGDRDSTWRQRKDAFFSEGNRPGSVERRSAATGAESVFSFSSAFCTSTLRFLSNLLDEREAINEEEESDHDDLDSSARSHYLESDALASSASQGFNLPRKGLLRENFDDDSAVKQLKSLSGDSHRPNPGGVEAGVRALNAGVLHGSGSALHSRSRTQPAISLSPAIFDRSPPTSATGRSFFGSSTVGDSTSRAASRTLRPPPGFASLPPGGEMESVTRDGRAMSENNGHVAFTHQPTQNRIKALHGDWRRDKRGKYGYQDSTDTLGVGKTFENADNQFLSTGHEGERPRSPHRKGHLSSHSKYPKLDGEACQQVFFGSGSFFPETDER